VDQKKNWEKIQNIYEGDHKVKKENLQTYRRQIECLKMKDKENVTAYVTSLVLISTNYIVIV
jgi:hypothetical protein